MNQEYVNQYDTELSFKDFLTKTFLMVAIGLAVTTTIAFFVSKFFYQFMYLIGSVGFIVLLLAEVGVVIYLGARITSLSKTTAYTLYFLYSALNGINISTVLMVYTGASVVLAFGMTTLLFICMSIIGNSTKVDLTKYSSLFAIGLVVLLIGGIINIFIGSGIGDWLLCVVGVVLFLGLIAYDMQRLRNMYNAAYSNPEISDNLVIYGALQLYLDFINLFIRIIRIFGRRRD